MTASTVTDGDVLVYDAEIGDVLVILDEANPPLDAHAAVSALAERRATQHPDGTIDSSQGNANGVTAVQWAAS